MHGKFQTDFKNPVPRDTPLEDNIIRTIRKNSCETSALDILRFRRFKVVIDAVNGGASNLLPEVCEELGCEVVTINCDGDGNFNRNPEPLSSNLKELESKVLEVGADIGFVFIDNVSVQEVVGDNAFAYNGNTCQGITFMTTRKTHLG